MVANTMNENLLRSTCQHTKVMKKHSFILVFAWLTLHVLPAVSQTHLQPGYIISNNDEVVHGMMEFFAYEKNPESVMFLQSNGSSRTLKPGDIKAFSVDQRMFVSATVDVETSEQDLNLLSEEQALQLIQKTVFLQVLIDGDKRLYYFRQADGNKCYYTDTERGIELLGYKRYYFRDQNKRRYLNYNKKYIGQLLVVFQDYPEMVQKIKKTDYTEKSLMRLFTSYYKNNDKQYITYNIEPFKLESAFGVMGGVSYGLVKFKGSDSNFEDLQFDPSAKMCLGLFY